MNKIVLKYGIIGGIISNILGSLNWLFISHLIGVQGSQTVGYISITLSLLCIPFGVKYFRDKLNNEKINFNQAFKIGLGITIIVAIAMALHNVLFFIFQKEEFLEWAREGLSHIELLAFNEQLAQMPEFTYNPFFQGFIMFCMVFLIGGIVNIISALLLRK